MKVVPFSDDQTKAKRRNYAKEKALKQRINVISEPVYLAPPVGLEPTTLRLTAACSTD